MNRSNQKFRPDIEGLRGFAVLLVLFAHAGVPGFSGGFVGVDIFFVISGYLITRLLRDELDGTGRVDFAVFYARRIKRLLPALFMMLVLVALASQVLLPADLQLQQAKSAYWASLWSSNFQFAFARIDYFDDAAHRNVFTHTWSLGVEEQFYLLWPVLLVVFWRRRRILAACIAAVGVSSLLCCLWLATRDASAAYYLMPTRLWQLAAGGWAGIVGAIGGFRALLGLVIGGISLMGIDQDTTYPSLWALLPVTAAVLLLRGISPAAGLLFRLMTNAPIRYVGRISYSLYLWHWPILVLTSLASPRGGWAATIAALLLSFSIAGLSERWIERPFRQAVWPKQRTIAGGLAVTLLLVLIMGYWKIMAGANAKAVAGLEGQRTQSGLLDGRISLPPIYGTAGFDDYYASDRFIPVVAADVAGVPDRHVLLAGDSILMQWEPAVSTIARDKRWRLVAATKSGCPMLDARHVNIRIKRRFVECERWREQLVTYIRSTKPEVLILGSAATYDFDDATWINGTRSFLTRIRGNVGRIVLFAPTPLLAFDPADCVLASGKLVKNQLQAPDCSTPLTESSRDREVRLLNEAVNGIPEVSVVKLDDLVCPGGRCDVVRNGQLVFRDPQHLNAPFVASQYANLARVLEGAGVE